MSDVYTAFYELSSLIESKVHYKVLIVDAANLESSCLYTNRTSILFIYSIPLYNTMKFDRM